MRDTEGNVFKMDVVTNVAIYMYLQCCYTFQMKLCKEVSRIVVYLTVVDSESHDAL